MPTFRPTTLLTVALIATLSLAACGGKQPAPGDAAQDAAGRTLPAPEGAARGGITGMPDRPGPGQVGAPPQTPPLLLDENGNPLPATAETPPPADATATPAPADNGAVPVASEPGSDDAVAVVRDYYAAINARNFDHAYALWSDGGRASGQDARQFADGFAQTAGVSIELGPPGPVDAGAGQRHIEIPLAIAATQRDGSQRRYVGAYVLRRAVVDGASAEQRAWRIGSADIREVKQ